MVCASWVDAMLIRDDLPELSTNLIFALASLDMYDLTHFGFKISGSVTHTFITTSHKDAGSQSGLKIYSVNITANRN